MKCLNAKKLLREMKEMTDEEKGKYITIVCEAKLREKPQESPPGEQVERPYRYPTAPTALIVSCYKVMMGFKQEDRDWDDRNFGRFSKTAVKLLGIREFQNNWERVADYMDNFAENYRKKKLEFTMETMYTNYDVWRLEHGTHFGGTN